MTLELVPDVAAAGFRIAGLALLAGAVAVVGGFLYRWYSRERIPEGLAVLLGLGAVAVWLNTDITLEQFLADGAAPLDPERAVVTIVIFLAAAVAAAAGGRAGDRLAANATALAGGREFDADLGTLVRSAGRVVTVRLPADIEDAEGYDPVPAEKKEALAGSSFTFPRGLTVAQLRERLTARLVDDHGVGRVDVSLATDGTVERLALGGRVATLGPTLPPGTVAAAVRADPPADASPGDLVQLWERRDGWSRVLTAELRAATDDVATLAVARGERGRLDPDRTYRLLTLPARPGAERELAAAFRDAPETVETLTLDAESPLVGLPVGALSPLVVAVRTASGRLLLPPDRTHALAAGETLHALGSPERLAALRAAAENDAVDTISL